MEGRGGRHPCILSARPKIDCGGQRRVTISFSPGWGLRPCPLRWALSTGFLSCAGRSGLPCTSHGCSGSGFVMETAAPGAFAFGCGI